MLRGNVVSSRTIAVAALLAVAMALSACGKKGDPEFPPGTQFETVPNSQGKPDKRPKKPQRPFALDGLLN